MENEDVFYVSKEFGCMIFHINYSVIRYKNGVDVHCSYLFESHEYIAVRISRTNQVDQSFVVHVDNRDGMYVVDVNLLHQFRRLFHKVCREYVADRYIFGFDAPWFDRFVDLIIDEES